MEVSLLFVAIESKLWELLWCKISKGGGEKSVEQKWDSRDVETNKIKWLTSVRFILDGAARRWPRCPRLHI